MSEFYDRHPAHPFNAEWFQTDNTGGSKGSGETRQFLCSLCVLLFHGHALHYQIFEELAKAKLRGQGRQDRLPAWLVERLEVFRRVLATLTRELDAATTALQAAAPATRPKGLGGLTSEVIDREVGDWNRFTNRRQVGSYTGLCGGVSSSGRTTHLLPITKHGNVRLHTALVELAWRLVIWQRESKLIKKWWHVFGNPKASRAARKKAIVAIARQLAVDLWRWHTARTQPETLGWKMTGP